MIRKLTTKVWISTGLVVLGCLAIAAPILWYNAPGALAAFRRSRLVGSGGEDAGNYYALSAIAIILIAFGLFACIRQLSNSVRKRVERYLAQHGDVTEAQLDSDFAAAREIGNVWIGKRWTFSHDLSCILLENAAVAWVFSEKEHVKNKVNYYLCLGLADGVVRRVCVPEEKLQEIIEVYKGFPHILAGNNPEYGYLFQNDRQTFLEMKYRQNVE